MEVTDVENWISIVKGLPYCLSTYVDGKTPEIRWIANLSNGLTIYDSLNNDDLATPSAWLRLKQFCNDYSVSITQLRLQYHSRLITMSPHAKGYFFAKRVMILANVINSIKQAAIGVGHLDNANRLYINWFTDAGIVESETREVVKTTKHQFTSLIVNNDI